MEVSDFIFYGVIVVALIVLLYRLLAILYTSWIFSSSTSNGNENHLDQFFTIATEPFFEESGQFQSFRVFCASERSLSRLLNIFPWESRGFLSFDGTDIHFSGFKARKRLFFKKARKLKVRYKFPRNQVRISYIPSNFLRDGGLEWLKLEAHNHKFYFTSGHSSRLKLGKSFVTTRDIYELVSDI